MHDGTTFAGVVTHNGNHVLSGFSIGTGGGETEIKYDDRKITITPADGASATMKNSATGHGWTISKGVITLDSTKNPGAYTLTDGSEVVAYIVGLNFVLEKAGNYNLNGMSVTTTSDNVQVQLTNYSTTVFDGISYTPLDENVHLTLDNNSAIVSGGKVNIRTEGFSDATEFDTTGGAISFNSATNKFTIAAGTKANLSGGAFDQLLVQSDAEVQVEQNSDGTVSFSLDNPTAISLISDGAEVLNTTISLEGSIINNPTTQEILLPKGTAVTLDNGIAVLKMTALEDAGGKLSFTAEGIHFEPNSDDGGLELDFVTAGRKTTLNMTGALTYGKGGSLTLAEGTEINFAWEDGNKLQLQSRGSTGSITMDMQKGIGITSADDNLDMTFSTAYGTSTTISSIKGTIWYNAGTITLDENTKLTAKGSIGGQAVDVTFEALGGTGSMSFNSTGVNYNAGTGSLQLTYKLGDATSTFVVNQGSVLIGHGVFSVAEGTNMATDLRDFLPALYFTTREAGNYTVNGQTIKTSAANLFLTATDNQMVFKTSDDVVEYDGMTFSGNGNVTLTSAAVTLGNGVVATGFGAEKSFVLTEQGTVTADAKVFELTEAVPTGLTVKGAQDGFIFSRTLTKESEERLGIYDSPDIGKVFSEEFHAAGDDSYRIETDLIGLEKVIGISDGATITGGATLGDELTLSYYVLETDTTGKFTIGEHTYTLQEGTELGTEIRARFDDGVAYADRFNNLNGTVSGDFTAGGFKINGSSDMQVIGDTEVSISANADGFAVSGLDANTWLKVAEAGTYTVNSTVIETSGTNFIVGNADGSASLFYENYIENGTNDATLNGTDLSDAIYNTGANVQVYGMLGNDIIANVNASNVYIDAGEGDNKVFESLNYEIANIDGADTLVNHYENNTIVAGSGNDYISNEGGYYLSVVSGEGNDTVMNVHGYYPTISTGNGDDSVVIGKGHYQYIDAGEGNDSIIGSFSSGDWAMGGHATLIGGNGNDYIDATDTNDASILGGKGNDTILISATTTSETPSYIDGGEDDDYIQNAGNYAQIYAGDGNDTVESYGSNITIDAGNGNDSITNKVASNVYIEVGEGDNTITNILDYEVANVEGRDTLINYYENTTIAAGSGNDYVYNEGGYYLSLMSGDGNDTVMNVHGYYPTISTGNGDDSVVIGKGHYQQIYTGDGNDTIIGSIIGGEGWAMGGHATLDGGAGDDLIDTGYSNDSSIYGGEGNDTIITSGENSTIDAGAGENLVKLSGDSETVIFSGKTTVEGFQTGFGDGADTLYITQSPPGVDFSESGLTFLSSTDSVTFSDIHHTAKIELYHTQNPQVTLASAVILAEDEWYSVTDNDLAIRNDYKQGLYFVGGTTTANHGVDFSNIAQDLNVTIDTEYELEDVHLWINNVHSIKGGAGNTTITGSADNDTILTGTGNTTIDSGAGDDYLFGGSGKTTFKFSAGRDVISDFNFASDSIILSDSVSSVFSADDNVVMAFEGGNYLTVRDAVGKDFQVQDMIVKVDKNISYDGLANYYVADGGNLLSVESGVGSAEIWLDNSQETKFVGNISTLDASAVAGQTSLVGNEFDNVIIASRGSSSLWGGSSASNDILQGNGANNTFFYNTGNGNDTIQGISNGDKIILSDVSIDQITSANITADAVSINFSDGGALQVFGNKNVTYQLADGSQYSANHSQLDWSKK